MRQKQAENHIEKNHYQKGNLRHGVNQNWQKSQDKKTGKRFNYDEPLIPK